MKKARYLIIIVLLFALLSACSTLNTTSQLSITPTDSLKTPTINSVVNEMLENARQDYVNALYKQKLGFKTDAINYFESAMSIINKVS